MTSFLSFENFHQLPLLRRQSDAQQRLVEFLKGSSEWDKLVDFYNEIGEYVRAQEICDQQANTKAAVSLEERIHWYFIYAYIYTYIHIYRWRYIHIYMNIQN